MTIPQVHIYIGKKTIVTTNIMAIPRMGEWILDGDVYFPVIDVFHGVNGIIHVVCHEIYYFVKDYKHETYDHGVEKFKTATLLNAAIECGDLKNRRQGGKGMNCIVNAHIGRTGELYKNIDCPKCCKPMQIAEMSDKLTDKPVIINFCEKCGIQVHEKKGQRVFHSMSDKEEKA